MEKKQITAEVPERKNAEGEIAQAKLGPVTVEVDYPETMEEAEQLFGAEPVLSNAFANWRVTLQSNIRAALKKGEDNDAISERLASAKMGVAQAGGKIDAEAAFRAKFLAATPEKRKDMIKQLRDLAAA